MAKNAVCVLIKQQKGFYHLVNLLVIADYSRLKVQPQRLPLREVGAKPVQDRYRQASQSHLKRVRDPLYQSSQTTWSKKKNFTLKFLEASHLHIAIRALDLRLMSWLLKTKSIPQNIICEHGQVKSVLLQTSMTWETVFVKSCTIPYK